MATSKCGFPLCCGYPPPLLEQCKHCNRNSLYHLCQTTYEFHEGYNFPMTKKCYSCVLVAIAEYNKKNNKTSTSVAPPTDNDILPTDTNPTDTNVVPRMGIIILLLLLVLHPRQTIISFLPILALYPQMRIILLLLR